MLKHIGVGVCVLLITFSIWGRDCITIQVSSTTEDDGYHAYYALFKMPDHDAWGNCFRKFLTVFVDSLEDRKAFRDFVTWQYPTTKIDVLIINKREVLEAFGDER